MKGMRLLSITYKLVKTEHQLYASLSKQLFAAKKLFIRPRFVSMNISYTLRRLNKRLQAKNFLLSNKLPSAKAFGKNGEK